MSAAPAMSDRGSIVSVNLAPAAGMRKAPQAEVVLVPEHGLEGDGHAGEWHRQVSLLAQESIQTMRDKGLDVGPGDFAENVTTSGVAVAELPIGTRLQLGPCLVEVTQIGKVCHDRCEIYRQAGDCVMPREGIFARVIGGGRVLGGGGTRPLFPPPPAAVPTREVSGAWKVWRRSRR
jgi:MOSC domain-containing protein YiiM